MRLEPRALFAAIAWDGGGLDGDWHNPLSWDGDVLPAAADEVSGNSFSRPAIRTNGVMTLDGRLRFQMTGSSSPVAPLFDLLAGRADRGRTGMFDTVTLLVGSRTGQLVYEPDGFRITARL